MKPAILLGTLRGSHVLGRALLDAADVELIALYDSVAEDLERRGIPCVPINRYLDESLRARVIAEGQRRAAGASQAFVDGTLEKHWARWSEKDWAAARKHALNLIARDFAENILLIELIGRCAIEHDLRLLVVQEDYGRDTRTAIEAAHRYGVPALHLLHGIPYQTQNVHDTALADMVAVQGNRARDVVEHMGTPAARIVLTGGWEWDVHAGPALPGERETAFKAIGLDPERPVAAYASTFWGPFSAISSRYPTYHEETTAAVVRAFAELQREFPDWQFLLRPHPGDPKGDTAMRGMIDAAELHGATIWSGDAYQFLLAIDSLSCTHSNLGVEAMLRGIPVINVALDAVAGPLFAEDYGPLFRDGDPVLQAREAEHIAKAVRRAMTDTATREDLLRRRAAQMDDFNFRNDGRALERVIDVMLTMAERPDDYARPVSRYPEFATALCAALPLDVQRVAAIGAGAAHLIDRMAALRPDIACHTHEALEDGVQTDAVLIADPLSSTRDPHGLLREAANRLPSGGHVVAAFRNGASSEALQAYGAGRWTPPLPGGAPAAPAGEFVLQGIEVTLSRAELTAERILTIRGDDIDEGGKDGLDVLGWVVCASDRGDPISDFAQRRADAQAAARAANDRGEALMAAGDVRAALNGFIEAINALHSDPRAHNNLGAALSALGHETEAYDSFADALHYDPNYAAARENLRLVAARLGRTEEAERLLGLFGRD